MSLGTPNGYLIVCFMAHSRKSEIVVFFYHLLRQSCQLRYQVPLEIIGCFPTLIVYVIFHHSL